MANQYRSALEYVAAELAADIKKYGVQVNDNERTVVWRDVVEEVRPYSGARECRRVINKVIKIAKNTLAQEYQDQHQGRLIP